VRFLPADGRLTLLPSSQTDIPLTQLPVHRNSAMLTAISKRLRPDPERAAELRRIFSSTTNFEGIATRIWPDLRAVRMTSTGSFAHYARQLANVHMRGVKQLSLIHAASEGFFGVALGPAVKSVSGTCCGGQTSTDESGATTRYSILPMVGFYEFIPVDQLDAQQPMTLFADQASKFIVVYVLPNCMFARVSTYVQAVSKIFFLAY
jgi:GH3 auxin-responsive promoter